MKFAVVVAALCGVAAAGSYPRPSDKPDAPKDTITCAEKNHLNQICDKACMVPIEDSSFKCCQWSKECGKDEDGVDIEKCMVRNCCEYDDDHVTPPPGDDDDEDKPHPKPQTICGFAQEELVFKCADLGKVVNFHEKCCHEENEGECGDQPICDNEVCCIIDTDLPEMVMNCSTKITTEEKKENGYTPFECEDDSYGPPYEVREDGYLCCRWSPYETDKDGKTIVKHQDCVDMGAHTKCREASCCVQQDLVCNEENSPKCVAGDREILYGLPCYRWTEDGEGKCNTYTHCCPN